MVAALKSFVNQGEKSLPVSGKVLDMTSKTEFYIDLQKVYKEKANQDLSLFKEIYQSIKASFELMVETSDDTIKTFCENIGIAGLEVTHF